MVVLGGGGGASHERGISVALPEYSWVLHKSRLVHKLLYKKGTLFLVARIEVTHAELGAARVRNARLLAWKFLPRFAGTFAVCGSRSECSYS